MAPEGAPANGLNGTPNVHSANGSNGPNDVDGTGGGDAYPIIQATTWNSKNWEDSPDSGPSPPLASAVPHPPLKADSAGVTQAFGQFAQLLHTPRQPLPTQNGSGTASAKRTHTGLKLDLKYIGWKDVKTFISLIKSKLRGNEPLDDHSMLMERVIQLVAGLPTTSRNRILLTDQLIDELWYSLDHPVLNYVGDKYIYRSADGSNNNPLYPRLGAAGTTYARSVRPTIMPLGALPDPGLIYDTVMRRSNQGYRKHPNNVSSILWYWATIIIHDLFWTDFRDMSKSMTSSYLDLSPLYGSNQDMQNSIRTFQDGKLKPDSYADKRLQGMPPGVSVLLIMFNRFHNHVAAHLAAINEGGRFTPPPGPRPGLTDPLPSSGENEKADAAERQSEAAWKKYDEDLFQTARLITSGLYINITLVDYVRNIVNLNRCDTTWTLDPRQEMGRDAGTAAGAASGTGNVVSAEFNLCYRWHSCISEKDDKWIQKLYANLFGKSNVADITTQDMVMGFSKFEKSIPDDPVQRTFNNYQRNPETGRFNDDDLVDCITTSIEDCAGAFGARNVPLSMKPVEILGILQGRRWQVAGLNEFRKHFGLKPYDTFEELNSDPEVAGCLRYLYEHPDFVELYPGIVAEEAKEPMVPGVGIAPTYTISRVVLSDAVCLVRGDRYYTTDYSPRALTNWGYQEVQYDLNINHGCCFYKLFLRAFPNHFKNNSVYAHYPMVIPSENHRILTSLNRAHLFSWDRPVFSPYFGRELATQAQKNSVRNGYSSHNRKSHGQNSNNSASNSNNNKILQSANDHEHVWDETIAQLIGKKNIKISPSRMRLSGDGWEQDVATAYTNMMEQLLEEESFRMAGSRFVDVVRDVGNAVCVQFVSRLFNLPLKTPSNPKGIYTLPEMHAVMRLIYINTYLDIDPVKSFPLRQATKTVADQLGQLIERSVNSIIGGSAGSGSSSIAARGAAIVRALSKQGLSAADIAWGHILPTAVTEVPGQAATFALAVDFYLSPLGQSHLPHLYRLACEPASKETDAQLLGFALEAIRLTSLQTQHDDRSARGVGEEGGRRDSFDPMLVSLRPGSLASPSAAAAEVMDPQRPVANYVIPAAEAHLCLGREVFFVTLTSMFRALFRLKNLRRAPGPQGELKKVETERSVYSMYLTEDWSSIVPLPCSMRVCWDE